MNAKKSEQGFTLVEAIVGVAVFAVIAVAFYFSINVVVDIVEISRRKTVANNLANEQMELLRNMPYSVVGVINGNPAGPIPASQTKNVNGIDYTINSYISYVDDDYDDLFPTDPYSADYKRARIEVCWTGSLPCSNPSVLISDFSANTVETGEGTGVMKITVLDDNDQGVSGAFVTLRRDDPAVYIEGYTDGDGVLIQPLLDPSYNDYHIEATKTNYGTDYTSPDSEDLDPINPDKSIIAGELTEVTLYIDSLSNLTANTVYYANGDPIGEVSFEVTGIRKILGNSGDSPPEPVYKYQQINTSNAAGILEMLQIESDFYYFRLAGESANLYSIAAFQTPEVSPDPVTTIRINSGTTNSLNIYLDDFTPFNILFTIRDDFNNPIPEANIRLWDNADYDETRPTTIFGQEFFRELENKTYNYSITKAGYTEDTGTIEVTGQLQPEIILNPL
jgi:prepilin-type N-terminal cleavage/methylation domain-containing protein